LYWIQPSHTFNYRFNSFLYFSFCSLDHSTDRQTSPKTRMESRKKSRMIDSTYVHR
jgi:hypothetical protein